MSSDLRPLKLHYYSMILVRIALALIIMALLIATSSKFIFKNPGTIIQYATDLVYVGVGIFFTSIFLAIIGAITTVKSSREPSVSMPMESSRGADLAILVGVLMYIIETIAFAVIGIYVGNLFAPRLSALLNNDILLIIMVWLSLTALTALLSYAVLVLISVVLTKAFRISMEPVVVYSDGLFGLTLVFPGVGRKVVVASRGEYVKYVIAHEEAHANSKGTSLLPLLLLLAISLLAWGVILPESFMPMRDAHLMAPFFALFIAGAFSLLIVFTRALEVHADFAVYRRFGPSAGDAMIMIRREMQRARTIMGVIGRRFSLILKLQRLVHPSRRDFALRFGDPIGAHGTWDFAIPSSLLSASMIYGFLLEVLNKLHLVLNEGILVAVALAFLGSTLVVTFLLSLILRPIVHRLTKGFSDRGISALSSLIASIYMSSLSVALFLLPTVGLLSLTSLIAGALLNYSLVRHYLSLVHGGSALKLTLSSYTLLVTVSLLLLLMVKVVMPHAYPP